MLQVLIFDLCRKDVHENFGIKFESMAHGVYITQIIRGSPAQQAGLRKDDRILAIEGEVLQHNTCIHHVNKIMHRHTKLHMMIERNINRPKPFIKKAAPKAISDMRNRSYSDEPQSSTLHPTVRDRKGSSDSRRPIKRCQPPNPSGSNENSSSAGLPNMGVPVITLAPNDYTGHPVAIQVQIQSPSPPIENEEDNLTNRLSDMLLEQSLGSQVIPPSNYVSNHQAITREEELVKKIKATSERMRKLRTTHANPVVNNEGDDLDQEIGQRSILDADPTARNMLGWVRSGANGSSFY